MSEVILPDIPVSAIEDIEEQYRALVDLRNKTEELMQALLSGQEVQDLNSATATTVVISNKVNSILTVLRDAGMVGE